jgi:cobalamin biosynthesis Mg chelatase CobN
MARARVNTQDKYRDKYEGMGFKVVNLEEPKPAQQPAATDSPAWKTVIEIIIAAALVGLVVWVWVSMLAPLFGG